jgi:hypothetical protein
VKLLKIVTDQGIAFPNLDNMAGVGINTNDKTVRFFLPNGNYDDYTLATREEAARLVNTLDQYTIAPTFHE